jgi:hypothetical protein
MTAALLLAGTGCATAQEFVEDDSLFIAKPLLIPGEDSAMIVAMADTTLQKKQNSKKDWSKWRPDAKRALWLALVIPGGGQIYNRKYWKLPIFYGGVVGCIYALTWNNQMYHDYSQAYIDISDNDPNTKSYSQFLHLGKVIDNSNKDYYQDLFRKRKDRYRRYRDLSIFALIGIYALSVIDAYVDASLSEFDISDDLSLRVAPTIISDKNSRNPMKPSGIGIGCSLKF